MEDAQERDCSAERSEFCAFIRFRMSAPYAMLCRLAIVQRYVASCPALSSKYTVFLMRAAYPHHRDSTLQVTGKRSITFFIKKFGVFPIF